MSLPIAVIGAGGWGTALAITMARPSRNPGDVRLWVYESDLAESMAATRDNSVYLPSISIPDTIAITNSLEDALAGAHVVIIAVPSHVYRTILSQMLPYMRPGMVFVNAAKGIENGTLMRMSEVITDVVKPVFQPDIAAMSGPTFAPEVARGQPTALVIASPNEKMRLLLQQELSSSRFRLYTNADIIGVEVGGAVKNIIAIAAGVVEGLGLGSNATAALISRGLVEIIRLAVACGGRRETLSGLAGLGDLVLTSYGGLSRNRRVGIALGKGEKIEEITSSMRMVAEGVKTTKSTVELAGRLSVEMPIVEKMYEVLYGNLKPQDAINDLMERKLREE